MAVYVTDDERDPKSGKPLKHLDLWCASRGQGLECSIVYKGRRPIPRWRRPDGVEIRLVENPDRGQDSFDTRHHRNERCSLCFKPRMLPQRTPRGRTYPGQPPFPKAPPPAWLVDGITDARERPGSGGFVYEFTHRPLRVKLIGGARNAEALRKRLLHHYNCTLRGDGAWWWYDLMSEYGPSAPLELDIFGPLSEPYRNFEDARRVAAWVGGWQNATLV